MCLSAERKPGTRVYNEYDTDEGGLFTTKHGFRLQTLKIHLKKSTSNLVQLTLQQRTLSAWTIYDRFQGLKAKHTLGRNGRASSAWRCREFSSRPLQGQPTRFFPVFLRKHKQFRVELIVPNVLSHRMLGLKTVRSNARAAVRMWPAEVTSVDSEFLRTHVTYAPQPERRKTLSDMVTFTHIVKFGKLYLSCNRICVCCMDKYYVLETSRCEKWEGEKEKASPTTFLAPLPVSLF
jgi:hypothetical protein